MSTVSEKPYITLKNDIPICDNSFPLRKSTTPLLKTFTGEGTRKLLAEPDSERISQIRNNIIIRIV